MSWFLVSDDLHAHPKWRRVSADAKALWVTAGSLIRHVVVDGVVDRDELGEQLAIEAFGFKLDALDRLEAAAAELVDAGLWQRHRAGWAFHDWGDYQRDAEDERERKRRSRRASRLHNTAAGRRLKASVIERDAGRCRYCGVKVDPQGGRGRRSRHFDHVDPDGPTDAGNVVLACGDCNRRKCNQTPAVAGMTLRPVPA